MRRVRMAGAVVLAVCAGGAFAAQSMAATASIAPSQLTAGKTVDVTVSAPQCSAYDVIIGGGILVGSANLIDSGRKAAMSPTHQFQGQVDLGRGRALGARRQRRLQHGHDRQDR